MLSVLIQKELRAITLSPKFTVTFLICSLLLILSVIIGINEYKQSVVQYDTVHEMAEEHLQQVASWHSVTYREHRKPSPLQIFSSGLSYDIGRWTHINADESIKMENSIYSDDPIFAVFRMLDFTFIVQIVFSLLAILFTFDAVNGEKERGTLRLIFSNAVPKAKYILAKCIGSWLGLVIPILIPILIALLLVVLFQIPMSISDWLRVVLLIAVSLLYVTLFIIFGVLVSTVTKRSSTSFLLSLVFWIAFVLIIPRGGVMAAGHMVAVPRLAEIEGWRDAYAQNKWDSFYRESSSRWADHNEETREDEGFDDELMWNRMQEEDSLRKEITRDIETYEASLIEDWQNKQRQQQKLGFALARISPAAVYQLAAMSLASTDISIKSAYDESLRKYRTEFNNYVEEKSANAGPGAGSVMITMDSDKGMDIQMGREQNIDVSDRPKYIHPEIKLSEIIQSIFLDISILLVLMIVLLFGSFTAFLKFDLR